MSTAEIAGLASATARLPLRPTIQCRCPGCLQVADSVGLKRTTSLEANFDGSFVKYNALR